MGIMHKLFVLNNWPVARGDLADETLSEPKLRAFRSSPDGSRDNVHNRFRMPAAAAESHT
jgi:hypothetical protein